MGFWSLSLIGYNSQLIRSLLDLHRLALPDYIQTPLHRILGLYHLPHAERLQTNS